MLKRASKREKMLLIALAVILVYLLAVQLPVSKMQDKISAEQAEVSAQLDTATNMLIQQENMQKKLDGFRASGSDAVYTPSYNNTNNIIVEMDTLLGGSRNYSISFGEEENDGAVIRRDITLQFTAESFGSAVRKLRKIEESQNAYLVMDTSINQGSSGQCSVMVYMRSFEYLD